MVDAYSPYDIESMLLGAVLLFGKDAAQCILPDLSFDKFIYGMDGTFLKDQTHRQIFKGITQAWGNGMSPTIDAVMKFAGGDDDLRAYMKVLQDKLTHYYRVYELDGRLLQERAREVDKTGTIFQFLSTSVEISQPLVKDQATFENYVSGINDVEEWTNDRMKKLYSSLRTANAGYQHVSAGVAETKEKLERIESGEQVTLVPVGMPSLVNKNLFPMGRFAIIHGMSSSGKSTFVNTILLGLALGLKRYNIKGCVAINSLEEERDILVERWAAMLAGFDSTRLMQSPETFVKDPRYLHFKKWVDFIEQLPIYIDGTNYITSQSVDFHVTGLHTSKLGPVWALGADYIELFKDQEGDNKEQKLDIIGHRFFSFSRVLGLLSLLVSQSTYGKDGDSRAKIAGPGGLRWSTSLQHAADIILEVWNPIEMQNSGIVYNLPENSRLDDNHMWILIEKFRGGRKGAPIPFAWVPESTQIQDVKLNTTLSAAVLYDHLLELPGIPQLVSPKQEDGWAF